ncbi:MAG: prepilin-type N-terminal cleavage/methylation domain-containing protein [Opitutaceae bacterium]|jgi:prepilin-type N-terminal cleavage/methylation domain-containing protein|nr:prepilin-type N-terminal cleavage/methylation domain-containing protein [Opitutaceae bacterium]
MSTPTPTVMRAREERRGFTLLEVLLALSLLGSLLVALNVFIFSMAEIWGQGRDERLFAQHTRAVSLHVEELLRSAARGPDGGGLAIKEVRQPYGGEEPELTFTLAEGSRLLVWPGAPLPDVEMSIAVDKQEKRGLVLRWQSLLETRREDEAPRTTPVSPFVVSLGWDYYDESFRRWETLEEPKREPDGTYLLPKRLRLRFAHGKFTSERVLRVPARAEGATNY